jgi:hypothetical protein
VAKARTKKTTVSQKLVGVGTIGMPKPVRNVLRTRIVASLIVLVVPILWATGLVSVSWNHGIPKLSINQQKTSQIKQDASDRFQELRYQESPIQAGATKPF